VSTVKWLEINNLETTNTQLPSSQNRSLIFIEHKYSFDSEYFIPMLKSATANLKVNMPGIPSTMLPKP
jgi:hypothetical protein